MTALIIVDIQNDFLPGGSLPVERGDLIIPIINALQDNFDLIIATQDWHPPNHKSFASNHSGYSAFDVITLDGLAQTLWPDHCVQGTIGAEFAAELNMNRVETIFRKGTNTDIDSYSGFYDNGHLKSTGLADYLRGKNVTDVAVAGLAGDICVYFTALDSLAAEFKTSLVVDASMPLKEQDFQGNNKIFVAKGGHLIYTAETFAR